MSQEQDTIRPNLLIVEDDADIRAQMMWALKADYTVLEATDRRAAIVVMRREIPGLVVLDLGLPPDTDGVSEGLAILREILQQSPTTKVIVVTGNSERANALAAVESGAYDFIEKPVQLEVLRVVLQRAAYLSSLERENRELHMRVSESGFEEILGASPAVQEIFETIRRVASSEIPVLITGDSGTGKELVARAIHRRSMRNGGPFIAINCGAIPETLLESELFGHERGAFTGANQQRRGRIESAQGGTLFLDEIGDIALALQVKLLRFLQDHEIQRLGGNESIPVDARILAATNVNLQKAIDEGRFREDLYYRLCVVTIMVPPLSERTSDIPLLARAFLFRHAEEQKKPLKGFTPRALEALTAYNWPGNVRELENRIKRAVVMADDKYITHIDLELTEHSHRDREKATLKASRETREKELVRLAMEKAGWNISKAAVELGISRPTLYQLLARYGLKRPPSELPQDKP